MNFNLPFAGQDKFGYDLNALAEGMSEERKLELADRHYTACDKRQKVRLLQWLVSIAAGLWLVYLDVPMRLPWW